LKIILGQLEPDHGSVKTGTNLEIAYFDQLREQLDESRSAADNVSDGSDFIDINGTRKHIMGYMQEFLFSPERARAPIRKLSGGERNRLLLARLFTRPANLLVLDEPTNDLDVETLELLEYTVLEFPGTVLLVSHDREFIDNIATSTIALDGKGNVHEYVGGYSDYLKQRPDGNAAGNKKTSASKPAPEPKSKNKNKLSYKLQRELDILPVTIEKLEAKKEKVEVSLADPTTYQQGESALAALQDEYKKLESDLTAAYSRWEELEAMTG